MEENKAAEYDLKITDVVNIYHASIKKWQRIGNEPRRYEGLLLFIKGGIHYDFEGFSFDAREGDVLKLPSGISYTGRKLCNGENEFYCIDFLTEQGGEFYDFPLPLAFHTENYFEVLEAFDRLEKLWNKRSPLYRLEIKAGILRLLCDVTNEYLSSGNKNSAEARIEQICDYISANAFSKEISISDTAKRFFISEAHLRRLFKEEMGVSPIAYLTEQRIKKAEILLAATDKPIYEIAEECGYSSPYYFSEAFKARVGTTAADYRKKIKLKHLYE